MEGFDAAQGVVLNDSAKHLVNDVLVWIGFGTIIGLLAKGIMPGRDPGGAIATVLMGIGGTVLVPRVLRGGAVADPVRRDAVTTAYRSLIQETLASSAVIGALSIVGESLLQLTTVGADT